MAIGILILTNRKAPSGIGRHALAADLNVGAFTFAD
jgi:hypothetical protein